MINPTREFYQLLDQAYGHFNSELFEANLPWCMLTTQRSANTMGYFSAERWVDGKGFKAHEIALNPAYFARHRVLEVLQTMVHEQVHLWQYLYGQRKSRSGYHNKEWADKMQSIGLMPSDTGQVGGNRTGQTMSDYPLADGRFLDACISLCENNYELKWVDTEPAWQQSCQPRVEQPDQACFEQINEVAPALLAPVPTTTAAETIQWAAPPNTKRLSKSRYSCPGCGNNVWGKPDLNIICGDCNQHFAVQGPK